MVPKVVPALLTDKKEELHHMLLLCHQFCSYVQIDIMDGRFVPSLSVSVSDLEDIGGVIDNELHLMVEDPEVWIEAAAKLKSRKVIFHIEVERDIERILSLVKKTGMKAGLAINPSTDLQQLYNFAPEVSSVLFMSVEPGFYGSSFIPSVLGKIKEFRKGFPQKEIGIDGGIKLDNLEMVLASGVDYVCVGSAILKSPDPKQSFISFNEKITSYYA